jgi:hypothetical protein
MEKGVQFLALNPDSDLPQQSIIGIEGIYM